MLEAAIPSGAATVEVQLPAYSGFYNESPNPVYSGIRFGSDGRIYKLYSESIIWQWTGLTWLLTGAASDYYLERAVSGDTLTSDAGDLQQMNANLDFYYYNIAKGFANTKTGDITFSICDDTAGSNEIVTQDYTLTAYRTLV